MKYIKSLLVTVLVAAQAILLGSCIHDGVNDKIDCEKDDTYLNLMFDTRSGSMPSPEDNGETGVASLRVFVYNIAGKLEHTQVYTPASDGRIENPVIKVTPGVKDIYVVANEKAFGVNSIDLRDKLSTLAEVGEANSAALEAVLVKYTDFPALSSNGLLMSGKAVGQNIPAGKTRQNPQKVVVEVVRNCARLDLKMQKSVTSASGTVILKKVEFFNGSNLQTVFEDTSATTNPTGATYTMSAAPYDNTTGTEITHSKTASGDDYQNMGTFYLTENLGAYTEAAHADAEYMKLTYTINGGSPKTATININDLVAATNRYNVVRNTCYVMSLTVDFELSIQLDILDWNEVTVPGDILGSRLDVSQSKFVMDWWNLGQSFSASFDFESDEATSFVGYFINGVKVDALPSWLTVTAPTFTSTTTNGTFGLTYHVTAGTNAATVSGSGTPIPADCDGLHPDVIIRLKSENITKDVTVVYDNGYLPPEIMATKGWTAANGLPDMGIHIAKIGNVVPDQPVADVSNELSDWAATDQSVPEVQDMYGFGYGYTNTYTLIDKLGDKASAALKCAELGEEWAFVSRDELSAIVSARGCFGPSYVLGTGTYWSSSEYSGGYPANAWGVGIFGDSALSGAFTTWYLKQNSVYGGSKSNVRCVWYRDKLDFSPTKLVADWWNWGKSFSTTVSFTSYDGTVSIQSIDNVGDSKNWLTEAKILSQSTSGNVTKGKMKVTYTPTAGAPVLNAPDTYTLHEDVKVVLATAGGKTKTLTVEYDNGLIPSAELPADWVVNRPSVGLHVAKIGNLIPDSKAAAADVTKYWSTVAVSIPAVQDPGYGVGVINTATIINQLGTQAQIATACRALGDEWFNASQNEELLVLAHDGWLGSSYKHIHAAYLSSTEQTSQGDKYAVWCRTNLATAQRSKMTGSFFRAVCNVGDMSNINIMSTYDEVNIFGGAAEYEITDAFYLGVATSGSTNSISLVSGTSGVTLSGPTSLSTSPQKIKLTYTDNSNKNTVIRLRVGDKTRDIKVIRQNGLDAHANNKIVSADFTGVKWISNNLPDFDMTEMAPGKVNIYTSENVTPVGWVKEGVASSASDNGAEPVFEMKKMDGYTTTTSAPTKVTRYIVAQAPPMYIGWFGGVTASATGGRRYSKRLIIESIQEEGTMRWYTDHSTNSFVKDQETGVINTQKLANPAYAGAVANAGTKYEAAYYCYMKNDINQNGVIDGTESIHWYLPASNQMAATTVTRNSQSSIYVVEGSLWSSTEAENYGYGEVYDITTAFYGNFFSSESGAPHQDSSCYVRCVRDMD